ncbi:glycosyltransferase [Neobacillus sp. SCS-31]|uniref:glycosyltransferase n=1 Tax=Neobacillus oceani TaxID=3115292 RepID=UPI003906007F
MKIVHIEDYFHPNAGYQLNILSKFMSKQGHDVTIITAEMEKMPNFLTQFFGKENIEEYDQKFTKQTGVKIIRLPIKAFISGRAIFGKSIFERVESLSPDILYIHGNDTYIGMLYLLKLKTLKYPIIMDNHMVEMSSVNPFRKIYRVFYKSVIAPIVKKHEIKVIRTVNDDYVEKCLGIPLTQCPFVSFGSDTLLFYPNNSVREDFRKEYSISEEDFVVVYTGKLDETKGGKFLAEAFKKKFINKKNKNIVLIIVGNSNGTEQYINEMEEIFQSSENKILRFPTQKYNELPKFYQSADLSVFPKECSLSFYDAQACALPVLSEDNAINIERLKFNNGYNFKANDVNDFREKILMCIEMDKGEYEKLRENAYNYVKQNYNYEDISNQITDILIEEYNRFNLQKY